MAMLRKTIEEISDFIQKKGGKCLSDEYKNNKSKIKIRCNKGHVWETNWMCLKKGTWCPYCKVDSTRLSISDAQKIARERDGYCLSVKYKNSQEKLKWKCNEGHIWEANLTNIKNQNQWCPFCSGKRKTINDMHKLAEINGGKCLSEKYIKSTHKLTWQCKEGHTWSAAPASIENAKSWCPFCKESKGENACRIIFQEIYGKTFSKIRPNWLKNKDGYNLEIDGINLELKIAFEYNGIQHRKISRFSNNNKDLKNIIENDLIKKEQAKKMGIKLIIIEQDCFDIDNLIIQIENSTGKKSPKKDVIFSKINKSSKINELHDLAILKGGECQSKIYINSSTKLKWKCKNGHEWEATPNTIKNGHWCQKCYFNSQKGKKKKKL